MSKIGTVRESDNGAARIAAVCTNGHFSFCIAADHFVDALAAPANLVAEPLPVRARLGHPTVFFR